MRANLLLVSLASSNSGERYCAVPTKVFAGSSGWGDEITCAWMGPDEKRNYSPPASMSFPVPKSVTLIRNASSNNRFSGLRSLRDPIRRHSPGKTEGGDEPMNHAFCVHVVESVHHLRGVVACARGRERPQARYLRLEFAVLREVDDKIWATDETGQAGRGSARREDAHKLQSS